jgi:excinuclease ABC subunit A
VRIVRVAHLSPIPILPIATTVIGELRLFKGNLGMETSVIRAHANNLQNISVRFPLGCMIGITGVSGSGKSTLAKEIIAKYGIRNYTLTLSAHAKKVITNREIISVDRIENLPATILIDVVNSVNNPSSVLSTITGIHTLIRELFYRFGKYRCPECSKLIPDDALVAEYPYLLKNTGEGSVIRQFIRCPSCKAILPQKTMGLFSFNVSSGSGGGACQSCNGTGSVVDIDIRKIIDESLPMNAGGISLINKTGLQYTRVSDKFLEAICRKYNFSLSETFANLSEKQKKLLLYGARDTIAFIDRQGPNGGKKNERFLGIHTYLLDALQSGKPVKNLKPYIITKKCTACNGSRYDPLLKNITVDDKTIDWFMGNTISDVLIYIKDKEKKIPPDMKPIINILSKKLEFFTEAGCSYLELGRSCSTLSGGELQRLRLCSFLGENISGVCILLDEPTTGLHYHDISPIVHILSHLKENNSTVILIEHNPHILKYCDYIIDLGPGGGINGGHILFSDIIENIEKYKTSTSRLLLDDFAFTHKTKNMTIIPDRMIKLADFSANTIKHQSAEFPYNAITAVCGVSGSGKSTFVRECLIPILSKDTKKYRINKIENLGQNNSIRSSISTVGSLLGINEEIAKMFFDVSGMEKSCFMQHSKMGKCSYCEGKGIIYTENDETELCPECGGKMFDEKVLKISIDKKTILDFISVSIEELTKIKALNTRIKNLLQNCVDINVGYLSLARTTKTLSKGEIQRIKLASVLSNSEKSNIYILDEPTKGLHYADCARIFDFIRRITGNDNTVIAIEHNLDFIANADYVIEFGPGAGIIGGKVVFNGSVDQLKKAKTATAQALIDKKTAVSKYNTAKSTKNKITLSFSNNNTLVLEKNSVNQITIDAANFLEIFNYSNLAYLKTLYPASTYLTGYTTTVTRLDTVEKLPVVRMVDPSQNLWKRTTKIVDILNCDREIAMLFTGGNANYRQLNVFSPGSLAGKCMVCRGSGRLELLPEKKIISNGKLLPDIKQLLEQTTMYTQAVQYLNELYTIDITKNIEKMTDEEYTVLLYGDRQKKFLHKDKEYYWEGAIKLVIAELRHIRSINRREELRSHKYIGECPVCKGTGQKKQYREIKYMNKTYHDFLTTSVSDISSLFSNNRIADKFVNALNLMNKLGLGDVSLFTFIKDIETYQKPLLLLISYLVNPIYDSCLAINGASWIENKSHQVIINNLLDKASEYCTVVLNQENIYA